MIDLNCHQANRMPCQRTDHETVNVLFGFVCCLEEHAVLLACIDILPR